MYNSCQKAQQAADKALYFTLNEKVGNFFYDKGDFALALRIHNQSASDYLPDSFPAEHLHSLVQTILCHIAAESYEQAAEVADRASRLGLARVSPHHANVIHAALGIYHMRTRRFCAAADWFLKISSHEDDSIREILLDHVCSSFNFFFPSNLFID